MELEENVLECIKEIHKKKKKKADLHTIVNKMKDIDPNDIKEILNSLCEKKYFSSYSTKWYRQLSFYKKR